MKSINYIITFTYCKIVLRENLHWQVLFYRRQQFHPWKARICLRYEILIKKLLLLLLHTKKYTDRFKRNWARIWYAMYGEVQCRKCYIKGKQRERKNLWSSMCCWHIVGSSASYNVNSQYHNSADMTFLLELLLNT